MVSSDKKVKRKVYFTLIFFLVSLISSAQNARLKFEHLGIRHGLSNNLVYSILEDSRGYIWIGTDDGLNRYDGYNFITYRHDPADPGSLGSSKIRDITEDRNNNLWIATDGGGFSQYDRELDCFENFYPESDPELVVSASRTSAIAEDQEGNLWIGALSGLYRFNLSDHSFKKYVSEEKDSTSLSHNEISEIYIDRRNRIWATTANGLSLYDRETDGFKRFYFNHKYKNAGEYITDIYEDTEGYIWLGIYNGGLVRLDSRTGRVKKFVSGAGSHTLSSDRVLCLAGDNKGHIYIGTENGGLNAFDKKAGKFQRYEMDINDQTSISSNSVYALHYGKNDMLWIGTFSGGVNFISEYNQSFRRYKPHTQGLNNPYVLCVEEDREGNLWIGTDGGGLNFLNRKTGKFMYYRHRTGDPNTISVDEVTAVMEDRQGRLWIGTYLGGVNLLDPQTNKITHFRHDPADPASIQDDFIHTFYEDSHGNIYIGMLHGFNRFDPKTNKFEKIDFHQEGNGVLSILEDRDGNLWFGTYAGLSMINRKRDTVINYVEGFFDESSKIPAIVNAVCQDARGRIWLGTTNGLYRFDKKTGKPMHYTISDNLRNIHITGITEDGEGNLWLTSSVGLLKMERRPDGLPEFTDFDIQDGYKALYQSSRGEIFFGGNSGLYSFFPQNIIKNDQAPEVVLTDFKIFNKEVPIGLPGSPLKKHIAETSAIELSHDQTVITFEFAALNFVRPEKNLYAYRMDGFENKWNMVGNKRAATYTNLDPGEYTFRVKASNNANVWNEEGVALRINIIPPWWRTIWAYMAYAFGGTALFYGLWRFQMNKTRMKHKLAMEHLNTEKLEEINRMKSRFFSDVAHEFRTPLTLIMGPAQELTQSNLKDNLRSKCNFILLNSKKLYKLINQLLDIARLENSQMPLKARPRPIISLLQNHVNYFMPLAKQKSISLRFDSFGAGDPIDVYLDEEKFEKIISNLFSNALKFTPEGGRVNISVRKITAGNRGVGINGPGRRYLERVPPLNGIKIKRSEDKFEDQFRNGYAEIVVKDTGVGFPKEEIDKVFNRFYQGAGNFIRKQNGSGIGLALAKELVDLHRGTIQVESDEGRGAVFIVRLPLGKDHLKEEEILKSGSKQDEPLWPVAPFEESLGENRLEPAIDSQKKPLILIVEDNDDLRRYLKSNLSEKFDIAEAVNGTEGLKAAFDNIPDLIVSDIMMPGADGYELCRKVKTDRRTSHIPVILLTAKATVENKIEGLETGADDYMAKPFDSKELEARIQNLIAQRHKLKIKFNKKGLKPEDIAVKSYDERFLEKALKVIEDEMGNPDFGVEEFARHIGLGRVQLYRKIRALSGQTVSEFIRTIRLNRAAQLLREKHNNITQIAYEVGFNSQSYFSKAFIRQFGVSPTDYAQSSKV